jgi:hypothetical protein
VAHVHGALRERNLDPLTVEPVKDSAYDGIRSVMTDHKAWE